MEGQVMKREDALKIVKKLVSEQTIKPEKGVVVRFTEKGAKARVEQLKGFDNFKARSLSKGGKKVMR